jgi:hypothetical protein
MTSVASMMASVEVDVVRSLELAYNNNIHPSVIDPRAAAPSSLSSLSALVNVASASGSQPLDSSQHHPSALYNGILCHSSPPSPPSSNLRDASVPCIWFGYWILLDRVLVFIWYVLLLLCALANPQLN